MGRTLRAGVFATLAFACAACGRIGFDDSGQVGSTLAIDRLGPGEALADFPLLVVLDDTRAARDVMQPDASDLRFYASDGSLLAHEVEQVGKPGGAPLVAWVRVPVLTDATTTIDVRYGDPSAPAASGSAWSDAYEAVWHMTGTGPLPDSTTHHRDGVATGTSSAMGQIAAARKFSRAAQDWIGVSVGAFPVATASLWMNMASVSVDPDRYYTGVAREYLDTVSDDYYLGTQHEACYGAFTVDAVNAIDFYGPAINVGDWAHIVATYDGNTAMGYCNGVAFNPGPLTGSLGSSQPVVYLGADRNAIGAENVPDNAFLDGMLDEVRLENVARSPAWIAYDEASMRDQLITYGPLER
jgi:hypothetical protein